MISAGSFDSAGPRNSEGLGERPTELLENRYELSVANSISYLNFVDCIVVRFLIVMLDFFSDIKLFFDN